MSRYSIHRAARIFDGRDWHTDAALLVADDAVERIVRSDATLPEAAEIDHGAAMLVPGFVDVQVNGGGGLMLNDRQDVEAIRTICAAHAPSGTTALLPTLITDTAETTRRAVEAGRAAAQARVRGFAGLHLEGPHLSLSRKGAHDPSLIRPMDDDDEALLAQASGGLPALLTTVAPESVTIEQVRRLAAARVIVSLGHSEATAGTAHAYADAGARMATHLFNAMSQIGNREPGLAGAAIADGRFWAGLIADGFHVHPETMQIALRAKQGPGRILLVTDAMATIGTNLTSFTLNGRTIRREGGRLTLEDGTLAGADLDMISAVRFAHRQIGLDLSEALRMASLYPAQAVGLDRHGRLEPGSRADFATLSDGLEIGSVWIGGSRVFPA